MDALPVVVAVEESGQTFAEGAVAGQFVREIGTFGHAVASELERYASPVRAAFKLATRRTVLQGRRRLRHTAACRIGWQWRSALSTLARNLSSKRIEEKQKQILAISRNLC